ncbi:hypothetical protein [Enterococcus sp. UD-01]|jgi:hypothetical protein|uniref:hypothetical protein n=1 Tax=Enterococcus sp. UD-01 TaxID=3373911 RepID=UPI0038393E5E
MTLKYKPKIWLTPLYLLLILGSLFIYLSKRWELELFLSVYPDFYLHVSNFSISLIFGLISYIWLLFGIEFKYVVFYLLAIVSANFLCETVLGFMNTTDMTDALFGCVGVAISFIFLLVTVKYGMEEIDVQ